MNASAKALAAMVPPRFTLGVATSAFQIEGALDEDGRGPSGWDVFAAQPGSIVEDHSPAVSSDHYHRMPEDVALMKELGIDSYRFSLSWSRIQPGGSGPVNPAGPGFLRPADRPAAGQRYLPDGHPVPLGYPAAAGRGRRLDEPGHGLPARGIRRDRGRRLRGPGGPLGHRQRTCHGHHQRLPLRPARTRQAADAQGAADRPPSTAGPWTCRCRRCAPRTCRARLASPTSIPPWCPPPEIRWTRSARPSWTCSRTGSTRTRCCSASTLTLSGRPPSFPRPSARPARTWS